MAKLKPTDNTYTIIGKAYLDENYYSQDQIIMILLEYYTKTELNSLLGSDYYTQDQVDIIVSTLVDNTELTNALANYVTSFDLTNTLSSYTTTEALNLALQDYVSEASLTAILANYVTSSALNDLLVNNYATITDVNIGLATKENSLGNPLVNTKMLVSTTAGTRSWADIPSTSIVAYPTTINTLVPTGRIIAGSYIEYYAYWSGPLIQAGETGKLIFDGDDSIAGVSIEANYLAMGGKSIQPTIYINAIVDATQVYMDYPSSTSGGGGGIIFRVLKSS